MTDRLADTLDAIRAALGRGDYDALALLSAEVDRAAEGIAALPPDALEDLRRRAAETAACLDAARNGFRAARRRVEEVRAGPSGLSTYDRDGRKAAPPSAGPLAGPLGGQAPKRL